MILTAFSICQIHSMILPSFSRAGHPEKNVSRKWVLNLTFAWRCNFRSGSSMRWPLLLMLSPSWRTRRVLEVKSGGDRARESKVGLENWRYNCSTSLWTTKVAQEWMLDSWQLSKERTENAVILELRSRVKTWEMKSWKIYELLKIQWRLWSEIEWEVIGPEVPPFFG